MTVPRPRSGVAGSVAAAYIGSERCSAGLSAPAPPTKGAAVTLAKIAARRL